LLVAAAAGFFTAFQKPGVAFSHFSKLASPSLPPTSLARTPTCPTLTTVWAQRGSLGTGKPTSAVPGQAGLRVDFLEQRGASFPRNNPTKWQTEIGDWESPSPLV
jgi:hypothetical protein